MKSALKSSPLQPTAMTLTVDPTTGNRPVWSCDFSINGRFLSQATTGVQRYGREITVALNSVLAQANGRGSMVAPTNAADIPVLDSIDVTFRGGLHGPLWEQIVLPAKVTKPVLSLCNTGPIVSAKQVVCIHDANVFREAASYSRSFRLYYRAVLPLIARRAVHLTTVSHASRADLAVHLGVAAKDIVVVPNGHEHVFKWNAAASPLTTSLTEERPFVLLLGSRARHKNAEMILNQAEGLDALGLDLVVAGGSAGIFTATSAVSRSNIRWLGFVSDNDLCFLYSRALCLAFPSRTEGFGLPIVEAMAMGCPVVSSDRASMPEVCGSAALLAAPDDPVAWRNHFAALAHSPELQADLRGRGREQVKRFSWTESARLYLSLFGHTA